MIKTYGESDRVLELLMICVDKQTKEDEVIFYKKVLQEKRVRIR